MTAHPNDPIALLPGLLGPAGPELSCEACFEQIDRYVDLQLAGADADAAVPGMHEHLAGCPACAEEHATLRELVAAGHADAQPPGA